MREHSQAKQKPRSWNCLARWLCVLPAALLARWLFGGVLVVLLSLTGVDLRTGAYPAFVFPLLQYLPSGFAFVFIGGLAAPGKRTATATILAALCIAMSLAVHVLGQSNPGLTNSMHTTGESLGAVIGVAATFHKRLRSARRAA